MKLTAPQLRAAIAAQSLALANIAAVEKQPIAPEPLHGQVVPNEIYLANESLFNESYFNEPLTSYAIGWKDPNNIEETLEFFAPAVPVPRNFTYAEFTNVEEFLADSSNEDLRAINADFTKVEYTGTKTLGRTDNRGLMMRVDKDSVAGMTGNWQQMYVDKLIRRLRRNSLRRAITLISAAATNTAKTWDTTAGKDPDMDVIQDLITAATASGLQPNRVGYGATAWSKRQLSHRAQNLAGGYASAMLTPESVAGILGVDQVRVSTERYSAAGAAKLEVVSNLVLMFFALPGASENDASNIKRFISPTESGGGLRVYSQEVGAKFIDIVVEHYESIKITSTLGLRKFTVS